VYRGCAMRAAMIANARCTVAAGECGGTGQAGSELADTGEDRMMTNRAIRMVAINFMSPRS